jgi:hypothetical protein
MAALVTGNAVYSDGNGLKNLVSDAAHLKATRPSMGQSMTDRRHPPVKVTFDTNTLSGVVNPNQQVGAADQAAYQAVNDAVKTGQIHGFFSEAVVTLDAIGRKAKAEVLGAARFVSETPPSVRTRSQSP